MQNTYTWLKFIHVVTVAAWFGGFAALLAMNAVASRTADAGHVASYLRYAKALGPLLIGPASGLAILAGILGMGAGHLGMTPWLMGGMSVVVLFILVGVIGLRPILKQLTDGVARDLGPGELRPMLVRQKRLFVLNLLLLVLAVWAMVFKPG